MECVHVRLARAERDRALVEEELAALREFGVRDRDEEQFLTRLLQAIEVKANQLRTTLAA